MLGVAGFHVAALRSLDHRRSSPPRPWRINWPNNRIDTNDERLATDAVIGHMPTCPTLRAHRN